MDDLIAFLNEQLASRKAMAVQAKNALDEWQRGNYPDKRWCLDEDGISINIIGEYVCVGPEVAVFLAFNDPDAVLDDVAAKRRIIDVYERHAAYWAADPALADRDYRVMNAEMDAFMLVLRLLALPYAGHPEFREEWRPTAPEQP